MGFMSDIEYRQHLEDYTEDKHYLKAPIKMQIDVPESVTLNWAIDKPQEKREKVIIEKDAKRRPNRNRLF